MYCSWRKGHLLHWKTRTTSLLLLDQSQKRDGMAGDGDDLLGKMSLQLSEDSIGGPAGSLGCCPLQVELGRAHTRRWEGTADAFWGSSTLPSLSLGWNWASARFGQEEQRLWFQTGCTAGQEPSFWVCFPIAILSL